MVLQNSKNISSSDDESVFREPLTQKFPPAVSRSENEESLTVNSKKSSKEEKSISAKSTFTIEDLTPDDEIFTLQCPENFKKEGLCQENIDFSQFKPTVTIRNELYQLEIINSEKKSISLAIPKMKHGSTLVNLPLKGHIVIKKVIDVACGESAVEDEDICDEHPVTFPNIKIRHPLLGSEWQTHIDLVSEKIKEKKSLAKDKSLQRKKEKNIREENESDVVPKKKKKHHT